VTMENASAASSGSTTPPRSPAAPDLVIRAERRTSLEIAGVAFATTVGLGVISLKAGPVAEQFLLGGLGFIAGCTIGMLTIASRFR